MGTVRGTESIIDEKVKRSSELLNESRLVLLFFLVEAGVLEHDDITFLGGCNNGGNFITDAVWGKDDRLSEELRHALGARAEGELVLRTTLWASQMRADGDNSTLVDQVLDGRDGRADTGVVGDGLSVERNIDIATDKDLLSLQFLVSKVGDGLLGLKLNERDGAADSEGA